MTWRDRTPLGWLAVAAMVASGATVTGSVAGCGGADQAPKKSPSSCPREKPPPPQKQFWWRK